MSRELLVAQLCGILECSTFACSAARLGMQGCHAAACSRTECQDCGSLLEGSECACLGVARTPTLHSWLGEVQTGTVIAVHVKFHPIWAVGGMSCWS